MRQHRFDQVPGLRFIPDYFTPDECVALVARSLELYDRLEAAVGGSGATEAAHIPQPAYVRSAEHNLNSEERFARVALTEANGRIIRCEYFPRYGEDGHALAYFQRNANLPDFVAESLVPGIHGMIATEGFVTPDEEVTWKLTMNFYKRANGQIAGFPFHVDIPANGVVTMILNVQREALFQIAKGDVVNGIPLPVGALLLLSGESRYEWKHRVLPAAAPAGGDPNAVERVSLVLGFQ